MSGIGSSEFILLLVIGLIVLGPKRLPEVANKIGGWVGQARRMTRVIAGRRRGGDRRTRPYPER